MSALARAEAAALDAVDPLSGFRDRFAPVRGCYMDGNSLGPLPADALEELQRTAVTEWGAGLVESWERWIDLPQRVGAEIAPLIGAVPGEVTLADSTTVNLFKLADAALEALPRRRAVVTEADAFPTDRYVLEGLARRRGLEVRTVEADPGGEITPEAVAAATDGDVALLVLSPVSYRTAALADMPAINDVARGSGAMTLWDLSHATGSVPVDLEAAGADLAVGCTYKYLCGGPGAPAFLYVRRALQGALRPPIWGWFGHRDQFAFEREYHPAPGIERFLAGTPPIVSIAAAAAGIRLVAEAGIEAIRAKSLQVTGMMLDFHEARLAPLGVGLATPRAPERRGSHLAFTHPEGLAVTRWLRAEHRVVADFRAPDTIRMAVAPLHTRFVDAWDAVTALEEAVATGRYREAPAGGTVT